MNKKVLEILDILKKQKYYGAYENDIFFIVRVLNGFFFVRKDVSAKTRFFNEFDLKRFLNIYFESGENKRYLSNPYDTYDFSISTSQCYHFLTRLYN